MPVSASRRERSQPPCVADTSGGAASAGQYSTSWQLVLAFVTLTIPPAVVMFLMAQRYIVAGLTAGAVEG